ncbi:MAG: hypothetical protein OdinLCB4_005275 [Candidatus Odinarchaeum yellowstonii]|uniref:Gelsolin-like domain-containing protein n=1 Tax=Odinarchaeota yellowstonii (strain LCB_4) TaxID=1841599 RepID=A0AAF0IAY3_ODILC|nr:MAG: hypothetical protein OdinLCB4_005275 [Candidatus Odinarchaeum yellowstonii]
MQLFDVQDNGDVTEITGSQPIREHLKSNSVFIIVDDDKKRIWIWKGSEAPVRKKFISARAASQIREERGLNYKVSSEDEGEESDSFLKAIGETPKHVEVKKPLIVEEQPVEKPSAAVKPEREVFKSESEEFKEETVVKPHIESRRPVPVEPHSESFESSSLLEKLETVPLPRGFERELVIVGNNIYTVTEHTIHFLGKKQIKKKLEKAPLGTVPEGVFLAEDYVPRVIVNNGSVMAIEFLKKTESVEIPTEEVSSIRDELKYNLSDLVDFFKIEIQSDESDENSEG